MPEHRTQTTVFRSLEAERIAREREPGDGSPQKRVVEQIENALAIGGRH